MGQLQKSQEACVTDLLYVHMAVMLSYAPLQQTKVNNSAPTTTAAGRDK